MERNGYERYEISAFSREEKHKSRHNLNYWLFGDYLGIGAGAHGKITENDRIVRTAKSRLPAHYLQAQKTRVVPIKKEDLILEFLMNALRLTDGFAPEVFSERTGLPSSVLFPFMDIALKRNMITRDDYKIRPTKSGLQYLNDLLLLVD